MKAFISTLAVLLTTTSLIQGHVYLTQPRAEFPPGTALPSSWVAQFPPPWPGSFMTGAQYAKAARAKGFHNLREFLEDKGPVCGHTLVNVTPKPIPRDGIVKFASTLEHPGPCEFWLNNKMAFHDDDCKETLGNATQMKIDFSKCHGGCLLSFYWLGLQDQGQRWQSYKNCVPLGNYHGNATKGLAEASQHTQRI